MQFSIQGCEFNSSWCDRLVFKGEKEDKEKEILLDELKKADLYPFMQENGDNFIISVGGMDEKKVLDFVVRFSKFKAAAFLDEFSYGKQRKTYVVYSEAKETEFTKCKYVGWCDGQADNSFSTMANILQEKTKVFSGTYSMTGTKWKISYKFPYIKEWNNDYGEASAKNSSKKSKPQTPAEEYAREISDMPDKIDFAEKNFVYTNCNNEKDLGAFISEKGGIVKSSVTTKTNYLIIGNKTRDITTKISKAIELNSEKGKSIIAVTETEFINLTGYKK